MATRKLQVVITGDAKSAVDAARKTEQAYGGLGSKVGGALSKVGNALKKGALVSGAAVLAKTLTSGFSRLQNLEKAEKMFEQMGLSAGQTSSLMAELDDIVSGTAFSLDEGATAMAGFVSTGMGLDEVGRVMKIVADAAAFGQAPLGEVAQVFQKIELGGRATTRELNQLQHRGLPVFAMMQDALGMTGEEFRKFVADGNLSSQLFLDTWEQAADGFGPNAIKITDAAKSMGDTTAGGLANLSTAFARLGAEILKPAFNALPGILASITEKVNGMKDGVGDAFDTLGRLDLSALVRAFEKFGPILSDLWDSLGNLARLAGEALPVAFAALVGALEATAFVLKPITELLSEITGVLAGHSDTVIAAVAAWGAWKTVTWALDGVSRVIEEIGVAAADMAFVAADGAKEAASGVSDLAKSYTGVRAAATLATFAIVSMFQDQARYARDAKKAVEDLKPEGYDPKDLDGMREYASTLEAARDKAKETWDAHDSLWGQIRGGVEHALPGVTSGYLEAGASATELQHSLEELNAEIAHQEMALDTLMQMTGMSEDAVRDFADALGIDITGPIVYTEAATAIREAGDAARDGIPGVDAYSDAFADLTEETSTSTDRLKAWKDMVDAAMGAPRNLTDSTIHLAESMRAMEASVKENGAEWNEWTEGGGKNLKALGTLVDSVVDLAMAKGEETGKVEDSAAAMAEGREAILKLLEAQGLTRAESEKLTEKVGFSAEAMRQLSIDAAIADGKVSAVAVGMANLQEHKLISLEVRAWWSGASDARAAAVSKGGYASTGAAFGGQYHSGGVFRAPRPGGEGWALLRDRERVLTPAQQSPPALQPRAGAPVHHTTIVQVQVDGSVTSDEDLLTFIEDGLGRRRERSPYRGIGV